MSNKTFIPAFRCKVGDWSYYLCKMKYAEVKRQIGFAYELGGNKDLNSLIQRGLGKRTEEIKNYLLTSKHRFLGALIVAAWGGDPNFTPIAMDDPEGMLEGIDEGFGCLVFDGTQQYFALDGQHRLKAIKEALLKDPALGNEDICVIMVAHYNTPEGKIRTKRLFTNINRNAKPTSATENIALDQDDGFAVITRDAVTDHPLYRKEKLIKIFGSNKEEGEFSLAQRSVGKSDPHTFTTLIVLYDCFKSLGFDLNQTMYDNIIRPTDEVLDDAYAKVTQRLDDILRSCSLYEKLEQYKNLRELRSPKGREGEGHPMMRPVVQSSLCSIIGALAKQHGDNHNVWTLLMDRLKNFDWKINRDPWLAVYNPRENKIISAKENKELLEQLIRIHLIPSSKADINRVIEKYKSTLGKDKYTFSEAELAQNLL